jgi:hypothetical protein
MVVMRSILLAALLWPLPSDIPPGEDAGVSFFHAGKLQSGESIRFRADEGAGWDVMPIHKGPTDKGMYGHLEYHQQLTPGGVLTVETSLMRRGRPIAYLMTKVKVEADRRYLVYAAVQATNPTYGCMGCVGLKSARIPGDRSRRLWVYYSFNGISYPILF